MVITGGKLNRHVRKEVEEYIGVHGVCGYGVKSTEGEMGVVLDTVVWNTWITKIYSGLITFISGG